MASARRPLPRAAIAALGLVVVAACLTAMTHAVTWRVEVRPGPHAAFCVVASCVVPVVQPGCGQCSGTAHAVVAHTAAVVTVRPGMTRAPALVTPVTSDGSRGHAGRGPPGAFSRS